MVPDQATTLTTLGEDPSYRKLTHKAFSFFYTSACASTQGNYSGILMLHVESPSKK